MKTMGGMNTIRLDKMFLACLILLTASSAQAFTLVSDLISAGWGTKELAFQVNEVSCTALGVTATQLNDAIDAAVNTWNSVPTSHLKLKRGATTTLTASDDPPVIYCANNLATTTAGTGTISTVLGGRPHTGSLKLNGNNAATAYFADLSEAQRQIVVAHEIGHVLGIGHSENEYALMYYSIGGKDSIRLAQDDIDALTWLNPRDEPADGIMGCGTISTVGGVGGGSGRGGAAAIFGWILLILLAWVGTRPRCVVRFRSPFALN